MGLLPKNHNRLLGACVAPQQATNAGFVVSRYSPPYKLLGQQDLEVFYSAIKI
jgi:hypothetical protein